jgi:glycine cleavage system H protein
MATPRPFGITHYAQEQLGDVVFVELPDVGKKVEQGKQMATGGVREGRRAKSTPRSPAKCSRSTRALADAPATVNEEAQGKGWFAKLKIADKGQLAALMDEAAYKKFVEGLH